MALDKQRLMEAIKKAGEDALHNNEAGEYADKADAKAEDLKSGLLAELKSNVKTLTAMLHDYVKGVYKDIPWTSIVAIAGGIVYFVLPQDVINDKFPGIGKIDDAYVIALVANICLADIEKYKNWCDRFKNKHEGVKTSETVSKDTTSEETDDAVNVSGVVEDSKRHSNDVITIDYYLDKYVGENETRRAMEIERLSALYPDNDITDARERAERVVNMM